MSESQYVRGLRERVGHDLLLMPCVAALVRDEAGRLLAQQRAEDGSWNLPGGAIDPGESPAQAVVREVREETGLEVRPERVAGVFGGGRYRSTYPNGDLVEATVIAFDCRVVGGRLRGQDGETASLRYFAPGELPPLASPFPVTLLRGGAGGAALFDPPPEPG